MLKFMARKQGASHVSCHHVSQDSPKNAKLTKM